MRTLLLAIAGFLAATVGALAQDDDACSVAAPLVHAESALSHVAAAIDTAHHLDVVVVGSASSVLPGIAGKRTAYPARLEPLLANRLPGVEVKVGVRAKPRQTAAEMAEQFDKLLAEDKPALVIWQTGTVDAMRGVDPDQFRTTLDDGVGALHTGNADVILMNMQYSPRTESMIAVDTYAEQMLWVAIQREVPLFDRLGIMRHWSELGTFDLFSGDKNPQMAEQVHDCIARLLVDLILDAAKRARSEPPPRGEAR